MANSYNPLSERQRPQPHDVMLAIENLVGSLSNLPIAITIPQIVDELVKMHHTEEDGAIRGKRFDHQRTRNDFQTVISSIFQGGYKIYELGHKVPVIPVTYYFFKEVLRRGPHEMNFLSEKELLECTPPKREKSYAYDEMGRARPMKEVAFAQEASFVSGPIAGIVIFSKGSTHPLIAAFHGQIIKSASGAINSEIGKLENTGINRPAISEARRTVDQLANPIKRIEGSMKKATLLPAPDQTPLLENRKAQKDQFAFNEAMQ